MKVCILGTGSSALAAAWGFLDTLDEHKVATMNLEITVIGFSTRPKLALHGDPVNVNPTGKPHSRDVFEVPEIFKTESTLYGNFSGSASFGGLTKVWGATLLEYPSTYLDLWRQHRNDLVESYCSILSKVPHLISGASITGAGLSPNQRQKAGVHEAMSLPEPGQRKVDSLGIREWSRLAISPVSKKESSGCIQCGQCLKGCAWDHIWSPEKIWPNVFAKSSNFTLLANEWVEKLEEKDGIVTVRTREENSDLRERTFDKVVVALGPIQTAALMLRSGLAIKNEILISDSQMYMLPFFLKKFNKTSSGENSRISLSDVFAYNDPKSGILGEDWFAQIYGNSPDLSETVRARMSILKLLPKKFFNTFMERIGMAMVFLPDRFSSSIKVKLAEGGLVRISSIPFRGPKSLFALARKCLRGMGLISIPGLVKQAPVGLGYHSGSSFPMAFEASPDNDSSDFLGRPNNARCIHIVDSSVLPALSSRPVTFSTMANSYRIAKLMMVGEHDFGI